MRMNQMRQFIHFLMFCLLAFYAGFCNAQAHEPISVYLTWQRSPESTMTVHWITKTDQKDDLVEYHLECSTEWKTAKGFHISMPTGAAYLIHTVELTNLCPGQNYIFRTSADGKEYKFQTMPDVIQAPIRFVIGGDMYHDNIEILHETNRQAAKTSPMFALVGGDIAYAAYTKARFLPRWIHPWMDILAGQKVDRWLEWLIAWKNDMVTPDGRLIPILPVIGNHDTSGRFGQTPDKAPFFYSLFAMPGKQGYGVLDFGNYMSIFLMDSGHTHPIHGSQAQWLDNALHSRQEILHKFAVYHVPAFPSVRKFNDEICSKVRKHWVPIFEKYHLTAAFEHHDHAYKRTYPIKAGQIDREGVMYLGDGAWGVDKPRQARRVAQKWYLANFISSRHFLMAVIKKDSRYVAAINPQGELLDEIEW